MNLLLWAGFWGAGFGGQVSEGGRRGTGDGGREI